MECSPFMKLTLPVGVELVELEPVVPAGITCTVKVAAVRAEPSAVEALRLMRVGTLSACWPCAAWNARNATRASSTGRRMEMGKAVRVRLAERLSSDPLR